MEGTSARRMFSALASASKAPSSSQGHRTNPLTRERAARATGQNASACRHRSCAVCLFVDPSLHSNLSGVTVSSRMRLPAA
jgi:hypothetical protein